MEYRIKKYRGFDISLYEPGVMNGYLMMDDDMHIRRSSYDLRPKLQMVKTER